MPTAKPGLLTTAFLVSYMLTAPLFGWLADRFSRWLIIAVQRGALESRQRRFRAWRQASGLLLTRVFLGVGEAGYGPAAPTIISDLYPVEKRGAVLAWFFMAIPVGSALGYALRRRGRSRISAGAGPFISSRRRASCWRRFACVHARAAPVPLGRTHEGRISRITNSC